MIIKDVIFILAACCLIEELLGDLNGVAFQYKNDAKDINFTIKNSVIIIPLLIGLAILLSNMFFK